MKVDSETVKLFITLHDGELGLSSPLNGKTIYLKKTLNEKITSIIYTAGHLPGL